MGSSKYSHSFSSAYKLRSITCSQMELNSHQLVLARLASPFPGVFKKNASLISLSPLYVNIGGREGRVGIEPVQLRIRFLFVYLF